jgi:hypothetical protein
MSVALPLPAPIEFDIKNQPDSPLRLIDQKVQGRLMPGSPVTVRNDSGSTVVAFVLRVDVEPYGMNKMVIVGQKGLGIGQTLIEAIGMMRFEETTAAKPVVSVDYVQFADGSSWGEDSLGRGKQVAAYLKGRTLALERLRGLLAGQDDTDIKKTFDVFGSSSFAEPNLLPAGRPPRNIDYSARGYEEVINLLRRMPRNTEMARDLARKLEIMETSPDH